MPTNRVSLVSSLLAPAALEGAPFESTLAAAATISHEVARLVAVQQAAEGRPMRRPAANEQASHVRDAVDEWCRQAARGSWTPDQLDALTRVWAPTVRHLDTEVIIDLLNAARPALSSRLLAPALANRAGYVQREVLSSLAGSPHVLDGPDSAAQLTEALELLGRLHRPWVKSQLRHGRSWTNQLTDTACRVLAAGEATDEATDAAADAADPAVSAAAAAALTWLVRHGRLTAAMTGVACRRPLLADEVARTVLGRTLDHRTLAHSAPILIHPDAATSAPLRGRLRRALDRAVSKDATSAGQLNTARAVAADLMAPDGGPQHRGSLRPSSKWWPARLRVEASVNGPTLAAALEEAAGDVQASEAWVTGLHRNRDLAAGLAPRPALTAMVARLSSGTLRGLLPSNSFQAPGAMTALAVAELARRVPTMTDEELGQLTAQQRTVPLPLRKAADADLLRRVEDGNLDAFRFLSTDAERALPAAVARILPWQVVRPFHGHLLAPALVEAAARGGAGLVETLLQMADDWSGSLEELTGTVMPALTLEPHA